jgi:hypothetical protein
MSLFELALTASASRSVANQPMRPIGEAETVDALFRTTKKYLLAALLAAPIGSAAAYTPVQSCSEDTLQTVGSSGEILVMSSGAAYEVLPGDEIDSSLWLPPSRVLICFRTLTSSQGRALSYYEIVNIDEGEKVGATQLR